jgi:hypothetical protein
MNNPGENNPDHHRFLPPANPQRRRNVSFGSFRAGNLLGHAGD